MFALQLTWLLGALVMPSTQSLLSQRVPPDAQGELQGAVASLFSVSAIIGPPLMTQLFRRFTAADAAVNYPGISFVFAALLAAGAFIILRASGASPLAISRPSEVTEPVVCSPAWLGAPRAIRW